MPRPRDPSKRRVVSKRYTIGYAEVKGGIWYTRIDGRRETTQLKDTPGNERRVREILDRRIEAHLFPEPEQPAELERKALTVSEAIAAFEQTAMPDMTDNVTTLFARTFSYYFRRDMPLEYEALLEHVARVNRDSDLNVSTREKYLRHLRRFFRFCIDRRWLERNPIDVIGVPRVPRKPEVAIYTTEEVVRIASHFAHKPSVGRPSNKVKAERSGRLYALLFLFLYATAMRIGETLALRWDQVTSDEIKILGKGRRIRRFPLAAFPEARLILDEVRKIRGSEVMVWPWDNIETPARYLREAKPKFGMAGDGRALHTFRASAEWRWREVLGLPIELISDLAGHSVAIQERHYRKARSARELADSVARARANGLSKLPASESAETNQGEPTPAPESTQPAKKRAKPKGRG